MQLLSLQQGVQDIVILTYKQLEDNDSSAFAEIDVRNSPIDINDLFQSFDLVRKIAGDYLDPERARICLTI
jgi:hypothetical protein